MPSYSKFSDNSIFADREINNTLNRIFGLAQPFPLMQTHLLVGGSVGLILQNEPPKVVKDVDLIVCHTELFQLMKEACREVFSSSFSSTADRFFIRTNKVLVEVWHNPKSPVIVDYQGIPVEEKNIIQSYNS